MPTSNPVIIYDVLRACGLGLTGTMLDVGMGWGKYGFLMREYTEAVDFGQTWGERRLHVTGVEVFPEYVTEIQRAVYDEIVFGSGADVLADMVAAARSFDLVLMASMLEHMSADEARHLVTLGLQLSPRVVVSTPSQFYEQGPVFGNDLERHHVLLTPDDFRSVGTVEVIRSDCWGHVFRIGRC